MMMDLLLGINSVLMLTNFDTIFSNFQEDSKKVMAIFKRINNETTAKRDYSHVAFNLIQYQQMIQDLDFSSICDPSDLNYICQMCKFLEILEWDIYDDGCMYFVKAETTFSPIKNKQVTLTDYFFTDWNNYFIEDNDIIKRLQRKKLIPNGEVEIKKFALDYKKFFEIMNEIFNEENWKEDKFDEDKAFNKYFKGVESDE